MKQVVLGFGLLITALLVLFRLAKYNHYFSEDAETGLVLFCILFFAIGVFLSWKLFVKKEVIKEASIDETVTQPAVLKSNISKRELEVLQLISDGLSNQQIADKLFLSEKTIKKHISNLFAKLEVSRRTEAVKKAKEVLLIN